MSREEEDEIFKLGFDFNNEVPTSQMQTRRPPLRPRAPMRREQESRSQWAPSFLGKPKPLANYGRYLTNPNGEYPLYLSGKQMPSFTGPDGTVHQGEPVIFPPGHKYNPVQTPSGVNQMNTYTRQSDREAFIPIPPQTPVPAIYDANSQPSYGSSASSASAGVVKSMGDWISSFKNGGRRTKKRKNKKNKTAKKSQKYKKSKKANKAKKSKN